MKLKCYALEVNPPRIAPARPDRAWMDAFPARHPYRCLPLSIANTYGWEVLSPTTLSIHWNGGPAVEDIRIECHDDFPDLHRFAQSNFSRGIVTFHTGYIFRTEPGWNLVATGPFNQPKDGISPLTGITETDWLPYPFTMNWQLTRPGVVRFEKGEPFCLVFPVPHEALEQVELEVLDLESDVELTDAYRDFREHRDVFRVSARAGDPRAVREIWQKYYFKGELPGGVPAGGQHKQKLRLAEPVDHRRSVVHPPAPMEAEQVTEGLAPVAGGRVWYRKISRGGQGVPLLVVNGGPAFAHDYLESLGALADDRPVIFYDQLGCGRSERPTDPRLWTTGRFLDEIQRIRLALEAPSVHLLGHGWGAALALQQAIEPGAGVTGLVLASPCLSMRRWQIDRQRLQEQLPAEFQNIIQRAHASGELNSEAYQSAMRAFLRRYLCRREPWPRALERTLAGMGMAPFVALWGPNPLVCTGALRDYDLTWALSGLSNQQIPTLFTCGAHDFASPATTTELQQRVPGSELAVFSQSSHTPHLEETESYVATLRDFLRRADQARLNRRG